MVLFVAAQYRLLESRDRVPLLQIRKRVGPGGGWESFESHARETGMFKVIAVSPM